MAVAAAAASSAAAAPREVAWKNQTFWKRFEQFRTFRAFVTCFGILGGVLMVLWHQEQFLLEEPFFEAKPSKPHAQSTCNVHHLIYDIFTFVSSYKKNSFLSLFFCVCNMQAEESRSILLLRNGNHFLKIQFSKNKFVIHKLTLATPSKRGCWGTARGCKTNSTCNPQGRGMARQLQGILQLLI